MNDYQVLITGIAIGLILIWGMDAVADWIGRMQLGKGRQETNDRLEHLSMQIGYLAQKSEKMPHPDVLLKLSNQLEAFEKNVTEEVENGTSKEATPITDSQQEYVNGVAK